MALKRAITPPMVIYPVNWTLIPKTPAGAALAGLPWRFILGGALTVAAILLITEEKR